MATILRNGSAGEEVKKLQQALKDKGYDLGSYGVDGIFGAKTESAVRKYQKDNGLAVDGIAGEKTLGSLYTVAQKPVQTTPAVSTTPTGSTQAAYKPSVQSVPVVSTQPAPAPQPERKPEAEPDIALPVYKPSYEGLLADLEEKLQAGQDFSYRLEDDPLYHQYRKAYLKDGDLAARDSAAKAAAATGGYGNSYAESVSQQTLQNYLQKLHALTPELAANAYDRHSQKQEDLLSYYKAVLSAQEDEYQRYQDALKQYRQDQADAYQRSQDALEQSRKAQAEAYDRQQDQYKALQTLVKAGYSPSEEELQAAGMTRAQAQALQPKVTASKTGSSSAGYDNGGYTETQIAQLQKFLGVTADGKFGPKSKAAMKEQGYSSLKKAMEAMNARAGYFDYDAGVHSQRNAQNNGQSMYSMVLKKLKQMHAQSEPLEKVGQYLNQMVGASYITQSEYLRLYNRYRDHKLSD